MSQTDSLQSSELPDPLQPRRVIMQDCPSAMENNFIMNTIIPVMIISHAHNIVLFVLRNVLKKVFLLATIPVLASAEKKRVLTQSMIQECEGFSQKQRGLLED